MSLYATWLGMVQQPEIDLVNSADLVDENGEINNEGAI